VTDGASDNSISCDRRLQFLAQVTGTVAGSATLAEQARALAEQVRAFFGADASVVRLLEGEELHLLASAGFAESELSPALPVSWGISGEILEQRRPLAIPDVRVHPTTAAIAQASAPSVPFLAYAGAPLLVEERVVGILGIFVSTGVRTFSGEDLHVLQIVANHIAAAIVNGRLYEGLQREIAERRRTEEELVQSQKMDAVGRLAGGIAHDFNNILAVINGYSELLLTRAADDDPARPSLREIRKAGERAARLTRQLLAFSRKQLVRPEVLDLGRIVRDTNQLLRRLLGEDVELDTFTEPRLGRVKADAGQIEQVLLNLAVNARDAMPRGGKIRMEVRNAAVTAAESLPDPVPPGEYVLLEVADEGIGMDPETRSHIFEPFFTTKEIGKGTGLGLATVYGVVEQSGGHIRVESQAGQGTTFRIYLPRVRQKSRSAPRALVSPSLTPGSEIVLLVEDEEMVRSLLCSVLQERGYTVLQATDGEEAVQLSRQHAGPIHLLLTDVVMPRLNGREVARKVTRAHPETKVLYMSGYTDDAVVRRGVSTSDTHLIHKPFTPAALARKVQQVLTSG
jgi:signal transduction histidine kinase/CheY-like chemotaxis protein